MDLVGKTLGRYRIVARLGRGGIGDVYRAYEPDWDRYVCIKVFHSHLVDNPDFGPRFEREMLSIGKLRHPNIAILFDYDCEGDICYMVTEYIAGPTLKAELEARKANDKPLSLEEIFQIVGSLCIALDYAHSRAVVHRDLKPANVMINEEGQVVLTDFGIARIVGTPQYTATGALIGTPAYMSPEQGQGQRGDERSDIYALGVMLFEMLTGVVPYNADTPFAVIMEHISAPIPQPSKIKPQIPKNVEKVIVKALAKKPEDRYRSAGELAQALHIALDAALEDSLPHVIIGYSHANQKEKDQILSHLGVLQRAGLIEVWSDDQIQAGADWEAERIQMIAQAKIALLLITAQFLTADFILEQEVPRLLERRAIDKLTVLPIIARACAWQSVEWLRSMEVRPLDGRPVWSKTTIDVDEALAAIVTEVANLISDTHPLSKFLPASVLKQRRIDAAVPSTATIGQSVDLLVQVRFPDSLLLGIEDWPTEEKPSSVKQKTEMVNLEFPVNKQTGELASTRLEIRVVTPDFQVEGEPNRLVEVPPYQYSKLLSFLLTPKKKGRCRINVEVYNTESIYLGTVPLETLVEAQHRTIEADVVYTTASVANLPIMVNPSIEHQKRADYSINSFDPVADTVQIPDFEGTYETIASASPSQVPSMPARDLAAGTKEVLQGSSGLTPLFAGGVVIIILLCLALLILWFLSG